jgi:hypothetical protein
MLFKVVVFMKILQVEDDFKQIWFNYKIDIELNLIYSKYFLFVFFLLVLVYVIIEIYSLSIPR